ncbi:uncharacterized protein [Henckelia pumila]|uniref:uncharacterized protein n=1 Tax=Henckelia pumila TaxID=405737 RepID=UPI003C6E6576
MSPNRQKRRRWRVEYRSPLYAELLQQLKRQLTHSFTVIRRGCLHFLSKRGTIYISDSSGGGSWAPGPADPRKEDFRSKVGVESKATSSNVLRSKKHLAWYVAYHENPLEKKLSRVPQIKWTCPPKLVLDPGWQLACGEESSEIETQKYRETTVMEAVYPHPSAIPPSPSISPDMEGDHDDGSQIPIIPIVPIEGTEVTEMTFDTSAPVKTFNCHSTSENLDLNLSRFNSSVSLNRPTGEKSLLNVLHDLAGSNLAVAAGAAATVAAAMESKHGIDTELLIKFLTDPEMMKTLVNKTGIAANSEPRFPSGPKFAIYPLSSNSTTDPGIDIFAPVATNQPIPIKESATDLGLTPAKLQPIPVKESATDLGLTPAKLQPIPVKESASDLGVTPAKHQPIPFKESASNLSVIPAKHQPIPVKESASILSVTPAKHLPIPIKESASDLSVPSAKRVRICPPIPVETWSPAPLRSSSHPPLIQNWTNGSWSLAPLRPNSHPPLIQNWTNEAREPAIAHPNSTAGTTELRPLTAPTLSYNENQYVRPINQYSVPNAAPIPPLYPSFSILNSDAASKPPPFLTGINPVPYPPRFSSILVPYPPPFSSTARPYMHCITDRYRAVDHVGLNPCVGSNSPMPFAAFGGLNFTSTGTFCPCPPFTYLKKLPSQVEDINFCKSLIKQHGEGHVGNSEKQPFMHEHHTNPVQ